MNHSHNHTYHDTVVVYNGELDWGMFLICESGGKAIFPTDDELEDATGNSKSFIYKRDLLVLLTESHVEGKNVHARVGSNNSVDSTWSEFLIHTDTGKLYIGDILKTHFVQLDFGSERAIRLFVRVLDAAEVKIELAFPVDFNVL